MMNEGMYENKEFGVESEPEPEPEFDITNASMEVMTSVNVEMVLDDGEEMAETMPEMDMEEVPEFEGEEDTMFAYLGDPGSGLGMEEGIEKIHIALTGDSSGHEEETVSTEAVYRADYNLTFPGNMEVEVFRSVHAKSSLLTFLYAFCDANSFLVSLVAVRTGPPDCHLNLPPRSWYSRTFTTMLTIYRLLQL